MSSLTPFGSNGLSKVTPEPLSGAGGAGLNANFDAIETALNLRATSSALSTHLADLAAHGATSANTASHIVARDASGNFAAGTITAALTGTASGNVPNARTISTTAPLAGGGALSSNLTLSMPAATDGVSGYMSAADWGRLEGICNDATVRGGDETFNSLIVATSVTAATFSGSGASLTAINASNISSGSLADARLSSNVALKNINNSFTTSQTISGNIIATAALVGGSTGPQIKNSSGEIQARNNADNNYAAFRCDSIYAGSGFRGGGYILESGGSNNINLGNSVSGAANTLRMPDGSASTPSLLYHGETNTGIYRSATNELAVTIAGTQRGKFTTSGLTITGTATATTFSGSGASLTSLPAANITGSHTLPDGVLSTNVPLLNAANSFTANQSVTGTITASKRVSSGVVAVPIVGDHTVMDARDGNLFRVPGDGTNVIDGPTNGADGQKILICIQPNADNDCYFGDGFRFDPSGAPFVGFGALTNGSNNYYGFIYDSAAAKWDYLGSSVGVI